MDRVLEMETGVRNSFRPLLSFTESDFQLRVLANVSALLRDFSTPLPPDSFIGMQICVASTLGYLSGHKFFVEI